METIKDALVIFLFIKYSVHSIFLLGKKVLEATIFLGFSLNFNRK